ncbi:hypothetical protein [Neptuniibacter sp. QD37_11]|uniref:hypothetical protein n=1 Tax=Neptuniibacter sp. QD37_11 TaxID=3398209 RepID=UPI0039F608B8
MSIEPIQALIQLLSRGRFDYVDEKVCQEQIERFLITKGVEFEREYILPEGNGIIDFYFPKSGLGLEIKASAQWSKTEVYRQCERYCKCEQITGLVLATGKSQGLPESINGKPVQVFKLGALLL